MPPSRQTSPTSRIAIVALTIVIGAAVTAACSSPRLPTQPRAQDGRPSMQSSLPAREGNEQMNEFNIGDTVRITGPILTGSVGTVVSKDEARRRYLVRITEQTQNYYPAGELEIFKP